MCRFPIRIKNKGYKVNDFNSPLYVDVPCGHCEECKQSRISEYVYRATYELDATRRKGGFASFLTLTFNTESLNVVTCKNGFTCSTWNNVLLTKFKHRLQKSLTRKGYQFKYICTCERGHEGTKRPHYHLILFVVPVSPVCSITPEWVSRECARLWSHNPRGNTSIDLSLKYAPFKPCTRYVAKTQPIGFVFNEAISRTDEEAVKYVVKYCVKDAMENTYQLKDIVSSRFPISEIDMLPRTTQSNLIGVSLFDSLQHLEISRTFKGSRSSLHYDVSPFHLPETAQTLLNLRTHASDGSPINLPRYYVKKLCQRPVINARFPIADDTLYFNGMEYSYKFQQKEPVHVLVNRKRHDDWRLQCHPDIIKLTNYRMCTRSTMDKSLFSVYLGNASLADQIERMWQTLCSLRVYNFRFMSGCNPDYLNLMDQKLVTRAQRILQSGVDFSPLFLFGFDEFERLYKSYYHDAHCDSRLTRLLSQLISISSFSRCYNSVENTQLNAKKYRENLANAVQNRPLLFVKREL